MPSVKIYHNINRDANFGYNVVFDREGNHVAREPAERHELVLVFAYALPPDAIAAHRVICDLASEAFNIGTDELAQRYRARGLRSLSVGDVVMIDGDAYACDKAGWSPVSADDLRILPADEAERAIRKLFDFGPGESLYITVPLARQCFYIPVGQCDENGYIPSLVTEGEPGHQPLAGNGPHAAPWYWGTTYEEAERVCAERNAERGISPKDAIEIVMSSMAAGRGALGPDKEAGKS